MVLSNPVLHQALTSLEIGPRAAAFGFTRRLARDNGWPAELAARVVSEYLRFVYLCAVAGRPMTPSDAVDQAWHLHLTYTRSYWDELCGRVLGRPLHHEPTRGGASERARFGAQYDDTLACYRAEFDQRPPADIWPDGATRFGAGYCRVDRRAHWIIRKPAWRRLGLALAAVPATVAPAAATQIGEGYRVGLPAWLADALLLHSWILWVIAGSWLALGPGVSWLIHRRHRRSRTAHSAGPWGSRQDDGDGCYTGCEGGCSD